MKKFDNRIKKNLHDNFGINWHKPEDINMMNNTQLKILKETTANIKG